MIFCCPMVWVFLHTPTACCVPPLATIGIEHVGDTAYPRSTLHMLTGVPASYPLCHLQLSLLPICLFHGACRSPDFLMPLSHSIGRSALICCNASMSAHRSTRPVSGVRTYIYTILILFMLCYGVFNMSSFWLQVISRRRVMIYPQKSWRSQGTPRCSET